MPLPVLTKTYDAEADIAARRFVKPGSADYKVVQAASSRDKIIGVSERFGADAGKAADIVHEGIAEVECGASVVRGDLLRSDAEGKAIPATKAADRTGGVALTSGAAGDYIPILVEIGQVMPSPTLTRTYSAPSAIAAHRFVKPGSADAAAAEASAAGDKIMGVSGDAGASAGGAIEVIHMGISEVECGADVTRGDLLKSDSNGKAIPATAASDRIGGVALASGAANAVIPIAVQLGQVK